jgi:hypothetical protein
MLKLELPGGPVHRPHVFHVRNAVVKEEGPFRGQVLPDPGEYLLDVSGAVK